MKFSISILTLILFIQPLFSQTSSTALDKDGRTKVHLAKKRLVNNDQIHTATARNGEELLLDRHDKDEGVYEMSEGQPDFTIDHADLIEDELAVFRSEFQHLRLYNEQLKLENESIKKSLNSCCVLNSMKEKVRESYLLQNAPNPFNETSMIHFFVSETVVDAKVEVRNIKGEVLRSFNIDQKGMGEIELEADMHNSGSYIYTLFVDGQIVDSKVMILTK